MRLRLLLPVALGVLIVAVVAVSNRDGSDTSATDASVSDITQPPPIATDPLPETTRSETSPPPTSAPDTTAPSVPLPIPRVLIDTDLGGGLPGDGGVRGDPDDVQSLVRAIHYSDALGIEGIVSTEAPGTGRPEIIREWIRRTDVDHLRAQGYTELMTEAELLATVRTGTRNRRGPSDGGSTDGSRHIIARAHAGSSDDPLWVLVWGSLGTVAQALHDDPTIVPKIRLYTIGDYNSRSNSDARDFVLNVLDEQPDLWWVENGVLPFLSRNTYQGVWRGGNQRGQWNHTTFLERHIRGHGTDADGEFAQKLGDAFPGALEPREAIGALKEGDSPSMLYLLSPRFGGIGDLDDPTQPSWGGRFRRASPDHPNYYVDLDCPTVEKCQATINRHRVDFLAHWRDRWDRYDTPAE